MFFKLSLARRASAILVLASILSAPITSYGYDLPKENYVPVDPREEKIRTLTPGNTIFPVEHCAIQFTICYFGVTSPYYITEMRLREAINELQLEIDRQVSIVPPDGDWIDSLLEDLHHREEELQNFLTERPIPSGGDICVQKYRQCLIEEYRNTPKEEGAG